MNKARPNKLDPFAERLDAWSAEGRTLAQMREELRKDGCTVAISQIGDYLARRRQSALEERLLGQIASGARQCREVEAQFAKDPAPEFETLIRLHRVLILRLSTESTGNPELLELVNRMMKPVVQFARLQQLDKQISLDRAKFEFDAAKACLARLPELKAISTDKGLTQAQQVEQIRLKLFGELPEENA